MFDHSFTDDAGNICARELLEGLERPQFFYVKSHCYRSSSHSENVTSSYLKFGVLRHVPFEFS